MRGGQPERPTAGPGPAGRTRVHRRRRAVVLTLVLVLVLLLAWPVGLAMWANGRLHHVSALSAAAATPGTTYLLAGSDQRPADMQDGTAGARSDTILLLHVPTSGPTALISIPRDSYVPIPGHGSNKINAAYSWGGPKLLVATVEKLTGMKVDHYVEVGFGGIETVVNAVGGVHLCSDLNVHDQLSGLVWTPGCRTVDGTTALAFSRMRYSDPTGDVGRTARQRQVISAITKVAASPSVLLAPGKQVALVRAGTDSLTVDDATGVLDLGRLALDFRAATGPKGITGTPPIKNLDYRPGNAGSTVQLDPVATPTFFAQIRDGKLPAGTVGGTPK